MLFPFLWGVLRICSKQSFITSVKLTKVADNLFDPISNFKIINMKTD